MNLVHRLKEILGVAGAHPTAAPSTTAVPPPPVPVPRPDYAFISYSHQDAGLAGQFAAYLAQQELPPWVDNQLQFGESWERTIFTRIQGARVVLVLMSPRSAESAFIRREIDSALDLAKPVIPILIGGEPFPQLAEYQHLNLLDTDRPRSQLIEQLRDLLRPGQIPSAALQRRRVLHFLLPIFEMELERPSGHGLTLGIGFDEVYQVQPDESLVGELDELNWIEVFQILRERLPHRDLGITLETDFNGRFPTANALADFLMSTLTWEEIRLL